MLERDMSLLADPPPLFKALKLNMLMSLENANTDLPS